MFGKLFSISIQELRDIFNYIPPYISFEGDSRRSHAVMTIRIQKVEKKDKPDKKSSSNRKRTRELDERRNTTDIEIIRIREMSGLLDL